MADVVLAPATFDVTAQDGDRGAIAWFQQTEISSPGSTQQRILEIYGHEGPEQAAGSNLGDGMVVVKRELRIDVGLGMDVIVGKRAERIAIGGALIIVRRREVVLI